MARWKKRRSCLKMITCGGGGDTVKDDDDLQLQPAAEGEDSIKDEHRWSFRKRSTTHQSNTFPSYPITDTSQSVSQWMDGIPPLSASVNLKLSPNSLILKQTDAQPHPLLSTHIASLHYTTTTTSTPPQNHHKESSAVIIQAAIRGYLAQKHFFKLKNIVKLQAAFRGHLERSKAVGALRCVQAIVKMQALVRSRSARISATNVKIDPKNHNHTALGKNHFGSRANTNYSPTEKLLSNGFARQLLESAPKKKRIHIKCDPSKADSAWKWLERWVSVSTPDSAQAHNPGSDLGYRGGGESIDRASDVKTRTPPEIVSNSVDLKHNDTKEASSLKNEDDIEMKLDAASQSVPISINKAKAGSVQPRRFTKRAAPELPESENKKFGLGSRQACNPAFSAVQSKFEVLCSSTVSAEFGTRIKDNCVAGDSVSHELKVSVGGSDCSTELSISSTLDSPNSSNIGGMEVEHETEIMDKISPEQSKMTSDFSELEMFDVTAINSSVSFEHNSSYAISQQGKLEDDKGESIEAAVVLLEQQPERSASYVKLPTETSTVQQAYRFSPNGSPRSHMTVPESQGTPSSQVSANARRNNQDKSGSGQSRKLLSADKRSPSNLKHDSGGRRSTEQLWNDSKIGKRRNSFSSTRTDHVDNDSRDGSNPLPSYMQATESARAKAFTNSSPRSSPDVQDKHIYVKKRHSLPCANGKQVSPRIVRSMSQAQQGAKGNGMQTQDKKWVR